MLNPRPRLRIGKAADFDDRVELIPDTGSGLSEDLLQLFSARRSCEADLRATKAEERLLHSFFESLGCPLTQVHGSAAYIAGGVCEAEPAGEQDLDGLRQICEPVFRTM
ncbi:MAG TPA: hypothetical protein VF179_24270, partial [Thermoanaerobaculia bacterium]|nr:hypothetical protein [Thermoanaerobaculia bacterium]